ncbi:hypothetical protein MNBD_ALPHA08-1725 [hydrothermal vent metagenome]|uniref:LPS-assembly lipoprotein n=1 Tax=hydrothermal vent metagenome TaxID=652676 RepID=A0A3B0RXQ0_9ZZZZ
MSFQKLVLVGLAVSLGACGYQPLYGTSTSGSRVSTQLSSIAVEPQNTRTGQLIRNEILASIGNSSGKFSKYRLAFTPTTNDENTVRTFGSDELRRSYQLSVKYTLSDTANGKVVHKGNTFARVSYDKTAAPFADYQAQINAQERAAKEVGNDIRTRLAAFFATRR